MSRFGWPLGIVIVQNARAVSDEMKSAPGSRMKRPQLLIFRAGIV